MKRFFAKILLLTLMVALIVSGFPANIFPPPKANADPGTYTYVSPDQVNAGDTATINWDFFNDHNTNIEVFDSSAASMGYVVDSNGDVMHDYFFASGANSISWSLKTTSYDVLPAGTYTVKVIPDDQFSSYATSTTVTVTNSIIPPAGGKPSPPRILKPADSQGSGTASLSGPSFTVSGTTDANSTNVGIYLDNQNVQVTSAYVNPDGSWQASVEADEGQHTIYANASDNFGEFSDFASIQVTITLPVPDPPTVQIEPNLYTQDGTFRLKGTSNGNRVIIYAYDDTAGTTTSYGADVYNGNWTKDGVYLAINHKYRITAVSANDYVINGKKVTKLSTESAPLLVLRHKVAGPYTLSHITGYYWGDTSPAAYKSVAAFNHLADANKIYQGENFLLVGRYPTKDGNIPGDYYAPPQETVVKPGSQAATPDPVNTANGNFSYEHVDLSIPSSFPLVVKRYYKSLGGYGWESGVGWLNNFERRILFLPDSNDVQVVYEDGRTARFTYNSDGTYTAPRGNHDILLKRDDGEFVLGNKDKISYIFSSGGFLQKIMDRNNQEIDLSYDGQLVSEVQTVGVDLKFAYSNSGLLTSITDQSGRKVSYEYDDQENLTRFIAVDGTDIQYRYNANHQMTEIVILKQDVAVYDGYDSEFRVTEQKDALNNTTNIRYDSVNHKTTFADGRGNTTTDEYDDLGQLIARTDALGHTERFSYDADGNKISYTDKRGNTTKYVYDSRGNLIQILFPENMQEEFTYDSADNLIAVRQNSKLYQIEYDSMGNPIKMVDPLQRAFTFVNNAQGKMTELIDPAGNRRTFEYDGLGRLTGIQDPLQHEVKLEYDQLNRVTSITDANNHRTEWKYDAKDRIVQLIDALNHSQFYAYDANGNLKSFTDKANQTWSFQYDAAGQLMELIDPLGNSTRYQYDPLGKLAKVIRPNQAEYQFMYDADGQLSQVVTPDKNITTYQRDAMGNIIEVDNPLQQKQQFAYDALNRMTSITYPDQSITQFEYDVLGRRTAQIDANGHKTQYQFDPLGKLTGVIDALGNKTAYEYTSTGDLKQILDALGHETRYEYNDRRDLVKVTDAIGQSRQFAYDGNRNLTRYTRQDGQVINYSYDPRKLLTSILYPDGQNVSYQYDLLGRRTTMEGEEGTTSYEYNPLNQLVRVTDFAERTLTYSYTTTGQRKEMVYPDGNKVEYAYNIMDRLTAVTDWKGQSTTYQYDAIGQMIAKQLPNGVKTSYSYNDVDRLTGLVTSGQGAGIISNEQYQYDPVGNLQKSIRQEDGETHSTEYGYDSINQLIQVTEDGGTEKRSYTYDAAGNRTRMEEDGTTSSSTDYAYDPLNRLVQAKEQSGEVKKYTYDPEGNLLTSYASEEDGKEKIFGAYSYDGAGRLESVVNKLGHTTSYMYDGDGNRIAMLVTFNRDDKPGNGQGTLPGGDVPGGPGNGGLKKGWDQDGNPNTPGGSFGPAKGNTGAKGATSFLDPQQPAFAALTRETNAELMRGPIFASKGSGGGHSGGGGSRSSGSGGSHSGGSDGGSGGGHGGGNGNGSSNGKDNGKGKEKDSGPGVDNDHGKGHAYAYGKYKNRLRKHFQGKGNAFGAYPNAELKETDYMVNYVNDVNLDLPEVIQTTDTNDAATGEMLYGADGLISKTYTPAQAPNNAWETVQTGTTSGSGSVGPTSLYYHMDRLGSISAVSDPSGKVLTRYHYDEFGVPESAKKFDKNWSGPDNVYGYTGLEYDYEAGLTYARARYYMPRSGGLSRKIRLQELLNCP